MKKILVIGSANVDMIMGVSKLPERGETVTDGRFMKTFGGKGANQAVAAKRAGAEVCFVTCLGEDADGDSLHAALCNEQIELAWTTRTESAPTGSAIVLFDDTGSNYLAVAPGSNYELSAADLAPVFEETGGFSMLLVQFEIAEATLHAAVEAAHAAGIPVLFNYAPARPMCRSLAVPGVSVVVNEIEAEMMTGLRVNDAASALEAARHLHGRGFGFAIVTIGEGGACVVSDREEVHIAARDVIAVDSTAAGDTFCGALAVALVEGRPLVEAARFATAAASICVQRAGAQPSIPYRFEIDHALKQLAGEERLPASRR